MTVVLSDFHPHRLAASAYPELVALSNLRDDLGNCQPPSSTLSPAYLADTLMGVLTVSLVDTGDTPRVHTYPLRSGVNLKNAGATGR